MRSEAKSSKFGRESYQTATIVEQTAQVLCVLQCGRQAGYAPQFIRTSSFISENIRAITIPTNTGPNQRR